MTTVESMDILDKLSSDDPRFTVLDVSQINVNTELLQEIADKLEINTFVKRVKWSDGSYYQSDLKKRIEAKVNLNFKNIRKHPTDFILSLLSKHVYSDSTEGSSVKFSLEKHGEDAERWNKELTSWSVLRVFNDPKAGRYYSVAYLNEDRKQVVLAHRGTTREFWDTFKVDSPIKTDLDGILGGKIVKQQEKAFVATEEVIEHATEKGHNVSFTGHSLGAWLAELSLFFAVNNLKYFQSKAVTFDSPGSALALNSFQSNVKSDETDQIKSLDITTYLSAPNFVNCCNQHIGKVYRIFPIINLADKTNKLVERLGKIPMGKRIEPKLMGLLSLLGHSMTPMVRVFDPITGKPVKFEKVLDWPHIKYQPSKINTTVGAVMRETLNSIPVLKFLPGIARWAYEMVPKPTFWTVLEKLDQFLRGNIDSQEFWKVYEHSEFKAEKGYPLKNSASLSPEAQFDLFYKGHYCTQELNPFQDVYNSKSSDWYLRQLFELSPRKIGKKEVDDSIKEALQNLKDKYKIKVEGNMKYICVKSDDTQVDELREEIVMLCERYGEIKEILEDKNAYSPRNEALNQSSMIISDLPPRLENIVERPKVLQEIGEVLNRHKYLIICAFGGTGKSTIAKEYGRYVKNNFKGQIVRFILAGSSDKINGAYRSMAEIELKMNVTGEEPIKIMQSVHSFIAASKSSVLFIFDNVENSEDVVSYIQGIYNIESCRVIITTRDMNLGNSLNLPTYELDPFTSKEAESYLEKNLTKNRFSPEDTKYLINNLGGKNFCNKNLGSGNLSHENLGEGCFVLPYSLTHAVAYFNQNKLCTVKKFIESLEKSGDPTGTFLLMDLLKTSELSWQILHYSAYLDPDFICLELIQELFKVDDDSLNDVIRKLEGLSLVNLRILKYGQYGLQVHRLVQHCVRKYANANQHLKTVMDEKHIFGEIIQILSQLFPAVTQFPDENWQVSKKLYPHAVKILEDNISCAKIVEISELNGKLGIYSYAVACNFTQALKYFKQKLSLNQIMYEDQGINDLAQKIRFAYKIPIYIRGGDSATIEALPADPAHVTNFTSNSKTVDDDCVDLAGYVKEVNLEKISKNLKMVQPKQIFPDIAGSLNDVGKAYQTVGKFSEALICFVEAIEMTQELYPGQNHPDIPESLLNLSNIYEILGDTTKALKFAEKALEMRQAMYPGENCPEIVEYLLHISDIYKTRLEKIKALKFSEEALEMTRKLYPGQNHFQIAKSLSHLSIIYKEEGNTTIALRFAEEALEMNQALFLGKKHPLIAKSLAYLSGMYGENGETTKALRFAEDALEMERAMYLGQNHSQVALCLHNLSYLYKTVGETNKALKLAEEALEMTRELYLGQNSPDIASCLFSLSCIYETVGEEDKAQKFAEEGLEMEQALFPGKKHPVIAKSLSYLSRIYKNKGETTKALRYAEDALEMKRVLYFGQNHPEIAVSLFNLSYIYNTLGEITKAIQFAEEALEMRRDLYDGQNHPELASSLSSISYFYAEVGEITKAQTYAEVALEMTRALYPAQNHSEIALSLFRLGDVYKAAGETTKALKFAEEALEMNRALSFGQNNAETIKSLENLSSIYEVRGENDKALKFADEALEMNRALHLGQNHPEIAAYLLNLSDIYGSIGEDNRALKFAEEALEMNRALYLGQSRPEIAACLFRLSNVYKNVGEEAKALNFAEDALEMRQALYPGQNHHEIILSLLQLGNVYGNVGETTKALKCADEAVEMNRALYLGQNHSKIGASLLKLIDIYINTGENQKVLKFAEEELEMSRALYPGQNHPEIAYSLYLLGDVYEKVGEATKALKLAEEALAMNRALYFGQKNTKTVVSLVNLSRIYQILGENDKALKFAGEALEMNLALYTEQKGPLIAASFIALSEIFKKGDKITRRKKKGFVKKISGSFTKVTRILSTFK